MIGSLTIRPTIATHHRIPLDMDLMRRLARPGHASRHCLMDRQIVVGHIRLQNMAGQVDLRGCAHSLRLFTLAQIILRNPMAHVFAMRIIRRHRVINVSRNQRVALQDSMRRAALVSRINVSRERFALMGNAYPIQKSPQTLISRMIRSRARRVRRWR